MKKSNLKNIAYALLNFVQLAIIVAVFVIQYLTNKKAGVMHHVYYKKYQYENSIFSSENLQIQKMISIVIAILLLALFIYITKKRNTKFFKVQVGIAEILSIMLYIVISSEYFASKLAYHYFIMAFALVLVIQIFIVILSYFLQPKYKK